MIPRETTVLVVGAGPVGLAVAASLAQQGVEVTVVDQQAEGANTSRAAVVHPRTMEALDRLGVADRLAGLSLRAGRFTIRDRDRVLVPLEFAQVPSPYRTLFMVPQPTTERVLLDRFVELGGRVLRPHRLTALEQDADGVVATIDDQHRIGARYVIGADGMKSAVRTMAGIGFGKDSAGESFTLADVRLHDGGLPGEEVVLFFSGAGMVVSAPLPDGSFRIVAEVDDPPEHPDLAFVQDLLDRRGPAAGTTRIAEVVWGSRFRVHHRVADRYRAGRVLLAGDAAHVHSPAGGQGMNLGLRDAVALGEALGAVVKGEPESLLDEYAATQRPKAEEVVKFAGRLTRLATASPMLRPVRNAALSALAKVPAFRVMLTKRLAGVADR
ncbi:FAD-dependent oxidoreductase [Amycolatopsis magusensis]|uniref:2-polyprenyl-6-methoxyphenol hydroxylase-like FAD-dependent oxidoreductase n=1 Tax=Amycolatopsis magusensis TaxID=882444 RepID=A0ABS4PP64_9PSEU|nr:FAD-dependent oxidoreductase [Amycolatopsis magusensis]MBP2181231.1 2-polyprenyl-6-methoxyphenol hydroxylase-like FAD-dependent oxidoreductase [Amycolatopsis magusensis]